VASKSKRPKALILVPHYFNGVSGAHVPFGSSDIENESIRKSQVESCQSALNESFQALKIEYQIIKLGIKGSSLIDLDLELKTENPRFLPWIAMDHANTLSPDFDFVMVIEDDIQINSITLEAIISFNSQDESDSILIANRVEQILEEQFCTDLVAMAGWKSPAISLNGKSYREPINIHSGLLLLTSEKFRSAYTNRPFKEPTKIIGDYMASAFANMHAYFKILRALPTSSEVTVLHLDSWVQRQINNNLLEVDKFHEALKSQELESS
jgi:hypothetical protein